MDLDLRRATDERTATIRLAKKLLGMQNHLPGSSFINNDTLFVAPSVKLPAILDNSEKIKEKFQTYKRQQSINNALQIMQQSDQILNSYRNSK
ncbi:hypothetical protein [Sporosarcina sp. BP05]|uniref:hypothetical protein n=1 Tax=Sporosarcina sp. BP05 TaxID=2758726 RepID=UPI00164457CF|nr:hypothetical protein [Sporosarcina sp. BP05]